MYGFHLIGRLLDEYRRKSYESHFSHLRPGCATGVPCGRPDQIAEMQNSRQLFTSLLKFHRHWGAEMHIELVAGQHMLLFSRPGIEGSSGLPTPAL